MATTADRTLERLRAICLALPEVSERISHGSPSFFIREKKVLCSFHPNGHHGEHGMSIWAPAPPGVQRLPADVAVQATISGQLASPSHGRAHAPSKQTAPGSRQSSATLHGAPLGPRSPAAQSAPEQ